MAHACARCRVKTEQGVLPQSRALPAILTDRAGYSCAFLVLAFVKLQAGKDNRVLHPDCLQAVGAICVVPIGLGFRLAPEEPVKTLRIMTKEW